MLFNNLKKIFYVLPSFIKVPLKWGSWIFLDVLVLLKVRKTKKDILSKVFEANDKIYIKSLPLKVGNIEHYYHFIFDLLLPLSILIRNTSSEVIFSINEFGPPTKKLLEIFPNRVEITNSNQSTDKVAVLGMDPNKLRVLTFRIDTLSEMALKNLNVNRCKNPNKILLIERTLPHNYYLTSANIKGSGMVRRSIKNHKELKEVIRNELSNQYEFHNLVLEKLTLKEQLHYFSSAVIVIGQHGAGLANMIWMNQGGIIVEFGYKSKPHFKKISKTKKHIYLEYKNYNERHISVDVVDFKEWLYGNNSMREFLKP